MIKACLLSVCLSFIALSGVAAAAPLIGWHWYNQPVKQRKKPREAAWLQAFKQLSPLQQLQLLQQATNNLKAKAVLSGSVRDITAYKQAQDFWVARATRFSVGWEQMLLAHPALNYSLRFPTANALAPLIQRAQHAREAAAIARLAARHGLLLFYRGKQPADRLFAQVLARYTKRHQLRLLPVSVDGVVVPAFHTRTQVGGLRQAQALGIEYFPALVLVNPRSNRYQIVSFGFHSEAELSQRLLALSDGWQARF